MHDVSRNTGAAPAPLSSSSSSPLSPSPAPRRKRDPDAQAQKVRDDDRIIAAAEAILLRRMRVPGCAVTDPQAAHRYVRMRLANRPAEVFAVLHVDNQHKVTGWQELFTGTIDGASVHPREVVRACIEHGSAAVLLVHNHPSGVEEPSNADKAITRRLIDALALIEVRVLDHLIVAGTGVTSFAQRGLL